MVKSTSSSILLVESNEALRRAEGATLKEIGYQEVLAAGTGNEAWNIIRASTVDLILSAWLLTPEMSGLGLLKVVRADISYSSTPFMLLVEEITKSQVIEAGEAGVSDIVLRPFNKDTFKKKIEQTLHPVEDVQTSEAKKTYEQGMALMKAGKHDQALNAFKKILTIYENAEIYYNLGYIKTAQGRYEEAILAFRKATEINNAFAQAYQRMGEVFAKLGRAQEAQKCFEQAAEIFMDKKMDENAEAVFMQALKLNPNTLNIFNSLGIIYRRQGRFPDAVKMYRKALRVNPFDEHIHFNLARVHMAAKDFRRAADSLRAAIKINPEFVEARNTLRSIELGDGLT